MGGPIVRTGTTPEFWKNWDKIFGNGTAEKTTKKSKKKAASKSTGKKVTKKKLKSLLLQFSLRAGTSECPALKSA